ncbi:MAG: DUF3048 domain-containing protein [Candidatus Spechtbacteria bacterium]|nr:DUF3048 domain-containing protein [Candidatus Spechtbacteria bacterium]
MATIGAGLIGAAGIFIIPNRIMVFDKALEEKNNAPVAKDVPEIILPISSLRGEPCPPSPKATEGQGESAGRRPFAVMMAEDQVARPLSGIGLADVVIEMPVITNGINRMMALFQCSLSSEIGSVRSARHDFIPLAAGFDAIFVHWGGSHYALDELKLNVIDRIDALVNPFNTFWRKSYVRAPHNGFTSVDNMLRAAQGLDYSLTSTFAGYARISNEGRNDKSGTLKIYYPARVDYAYDPSSGKYLRSRSNMKEVDALTQQQVSADVVVVMFAPSHQLEKDYNTVAVTGEGDALVFQKGIRQEAKWRKDARKLSSPLEFLDKDGKQVFLVRGTMWIQIADPGTRVDWIGE